MGRHLHQGHYVVDLQEGIDADLVGDITSQDLQKYFRNHRFKLIWFENTDDSLTFNETLQKKMFEILDQDGILMLGLWPSDTKRAWLLATKIGCDNSVILERDFSLKQNNLKSSLLNWLYGATQWEKAIDLIQNHGSLSPSQHLFCQKYSDGEPSNL